MDEMHGHSLPGSLSPRIIIDKADSPPIIFVDTYVWRAILAEWAEERQLLRACCDRRAAVVVITNLLEGELKQRQLLGGVHEICRDALVVVPTGRVSANQAIHAMIGYFENYQDVTLTWNLAISEVPVLDHPTLDLRGWTEKLALEINRTRSEFRSRKELLAAALAEIQREVWKLTLRPYADFILAKVSANYPEPQALTGSYDAFFRSHYFSELPFLVISSYFFGYVIGERLLSVNDIVDIYTMAELMPYTMLFTVDRDQHNRLHRLQKDYPSLFARLDQICLVSSTLRPEASSPRNALRSFLEYAISDQPDGLRTSVAEIA